MATMNISLPGPMKEWVEAQTTTGRYGNVSDYMRDLIRRDQERQDAIRRLQAAIDEGRRSGIGTRTLAEIREAARARARDLGLDDA